MLDRLLSRKPPPQASKPPPGSLQEHLDRLRSTRLIQLADNDFDWLTVGDMIQGTQIFGATGSGKTSGSGRYLATQFLERGWGGLVLTAKRQDADEWTHWARHVGRQNDLLFLTPGGDWQFNFLAYELDHPPPHSSPTHDVAALLLAAMAGGSERDASTDPFWSDSLRQLLHNTIDLALLASQSTDIETLANIIRTAPQTPKQPSSPEWQDTSLCWKLLDAADARALSPDTRKDLDEAIHYFVQEFPSLASRTRSIVVSSVLSKLTALLRSPLRELFSGSEPSRQATPELTHQGKVVIVNLPVKVFGETGRFAQKLVKLVWQRATERRTVGLETQPVFLWADEAQYFVTPEDALFQQTARSSLAATVYLTQSLSNYIASMGGHSAQAQTDSLLGNLLTKIFHANADPATNEWAERLIGRDLSVEHSQNISTGHTVDNYPADPHYTFGTSRIEQPVLRARAFTTLRMGGGPDRLTEAVVFKPGAPWKSTNDNFLRCSFDQGT